jgi:hypothetical protein
MKEQKPTRRSSGGGLRTKKRQQGIPAAADNASIFLQKGF